MAGKLDGGPAFPSVADEECSSVERGMTLRDWFAGQAMQGELASQNKADGIWSSASNVHGLAAWAYLVADAMIAERSKP